MILFELLNSMTRYKKRTSKWQTFRVYENGSESVRLCSANLSLAATWSLFSCNVVGLMKHLTHAMRPLRRSIIEKANSKPLFQICQVSLSRVCFSLTERGEKKIRGWIRNILAPYLKKRNDVIKKILRLWIWRDFFATWEWNISADAIYKAWIVREKLKVIQRSWALSRTNLSTLKVKQIFSLSWLPDRYQLFYRRSSIP